MAETLNYEEQMKFSNSHNAFMLYNRIHVASVEDGKATVVGEVTPDTMNPRGIVHGGFLFTLADCASGAAARSDGGKYSTVSSSIEYLRPGQNGPISCTATRVKHGKTVSVFRAEITGPDGKLLATGMFTMYCVER